MFRYLWVAVLGPELGLFREPYQRFGHYNDEMLRAMRLVVDTGIHAKGWTRKQAIDYMLANSGMGQTDATAEVDRYIATHDFVPFAWYRIVFGCVVLATAWSGVVNWSH